MTILSGDVKLLECDTMTDADEGGGAVTGSVIVDGMSNNIFQDISTLDRVYGAVHMRKVFAAIKTQDTDQYFGSHVIISKLPGDGKIGVNLFSTKDWFDRRPEAQSRVENYLAQGGLYNGTLWETQYQGSRSITIYQVEAAPTPEVGAVLILKSNADEQYIRITKIDASIQTFITGNQTHVKRILSIQISDKLEHDFVGAAMSYSFPSPDAKIYNSVVANAARYYTAQPLADAASAGDLQVKVASVYSQIVPSSQAETPILDANASGTITPILESAEYPVIFLVSHTLQPNSRLYVGSAVMPGSLSIQVSGDIISDVGGQLKNGGGTVIGMISYSDGQCVFGSQSTVYSGTKTITFTPAAAPQRLADTKSITVTSANRGYIWTININPAPSPTSLRVSFRALNKWYEMTDNGAGGLIAASPGIGSGTVNYITGSVAVTTGALPDVGSEIIFSWGSKADYFNRSGISVDAFSLKKLLTNDGVINNSITISWNDGAEKLIICDESGILSGDGSGAFNKFTNEIEFLPATMPLQGTTFTFDYEYATDTEVNESFSNVSPLNDVLTLSLSATPSPGTFSIIIPTWYASKLDKGQVTFEAENIYFSDIDYSSADAYGTGVSFEGVLESNILSIQNLFQRGRIKKTAKYRDIPVAPVVTTIAAAPGSSSPPGVVDDPVVVPDPPVTPVFVTRDFSANTHFATPLYGPGHNF